MSPASRKPHSSEPGTGMLEVMLRHALLVTCFVTGIVGLGACHLYIDEGSDDEVRDGDMWPDDCRGLDCEPEPTPDGDEPPPQPCETDEECAAGCYCSSEGVCEESNWCFGNQDCAEGFVCNLTGTCVPAEEPPPPPVTCEDLGDEACVADEACSPVYRGVNCTSETGDACTSESANCSCESFAFDSCEDA
jgi:hypothetical protein